MSGGVSNSSGDETGTVNSTGTRTGTSQTDTSGQSQQSGTYRNTSTTSTDISPWASAGNKQLFNEYSGGANEAVDFLRGLLSNPLDSSQPKNRYATALDNLFSSKLAESRSGDAQSIGTGKQAIREAQALTDAQTAAIGTGAAAANSLLTNANPYQSLDFSRLIAPTTTTSHGNTENLLNTTGTSLTNSNEQTTAAQQSQSSMNGSNSGFGITLCCFIFLEAYHGQMPWFVRRCRDQFCSGRRVDGYRRMASWLVPLMRKSRLVASLVWALMIKPLTRYGGWLYDEPGYGLGWLWFPVTAFWFTVWAKTGKGGK